MDSTRMTPDSRDHTPTVIDDASAPAGTRPELDPVSWRPPPVMTEMLEAASTIRPVQPSQVASATDDDAAGVHVRPRTDDILRAVGIALYLTDADGRIVFYNDAAAELWGRRPDPGELWCGSWRLYWPDGRPMAHAECPMARTLQEGRAVRGGTAMAERPDGSRIVFMAFPTPLRDSEERLVGAVNLLVDVTDRVAAERAVGRLNAVKDEFLGLVSHELRTPVTTIYGNAQLLLRSGDVETKVRRMLGDIVEDAERLRSIVENMLLLTRTEAGTQPDREPQLLVHILRRECTGFGERRGRDVIFTGPGRGHVVVEADRTYLELLITNLLANADKYSPPREPIEVHVRVVGGEAVVSVLDRGIGLADADPNELFTPFYRTAHARLRAGGMGIGLTVCRRIAESQGGRIWARPREGAGADVGFALPLVTDADA
jgi:PAS domain S-box-containing protein